MMRVLMGKSAFAVLVALTVSACGEKSTDTVDDSEITEMNAIGVVEGTTNDASAVEMATDTNIAADSPAGNATADAGNASTNLTDSNTAE